MTNSARPSTGSTPPGKTERTPARREARAASRARHPPAGADTSPTAQVARSQLVAASATRGRGRAVVRRGDTIQIPGLGPAIIEELASIRALTIVGTTGPAGGDIRGPPR